MVFNSGCGDFGGLCVSFFFMISRTSSTVLAGIAASAPGDANYSPMWRIFMISWNDPANASLLETVGDFNAFKKDGLIDINIARPMNADHIVNCPFIDPFQ